MTNLNLTLEQIETMSPAVSGSWDPSDPKAKDFPMAFYSVRCCWWTSFPTDLGTLPPSDMPCCPHCGSVLLQAPLSKFIKSARDNVHHYGPGGLSVFTAAHHRNSNYCRRSWDLYQTGEVERRK